MVIGGNSYIKKLGFLTEIWFEFEAVIGNYNLDSILDMLFNFTQFLIFIPKYTIKRYFRKYFLKSKLLH